MNALRHPVSSNTIAIVFLRGSTMGTRLLVLFVIARFVSPAEFGVLAFILTVTEIAKGIADFGVDTFAVREFAVKTPEQQQEFARVAGVTKLITGVSGYAVLVLYFLIQMRTVAGLGAVLGLLVLTTLWGNLYISYFQARLKVSKIVAPILLTNLAALVVVTVLLTLNADIWLCVAMLPLAEAVNAWVLSRMFDRELGMGRQSVRLGEVGHLLRDTLPLATTLIVSMLYSRLDVLVLAALFSAAAVGYYGIAFRITEPFQLMAGAFAQSSYSYLSKAVASGRQDVPRIAVRYGLGMLGYGLSVCLMLVIFAPLVIEWALPDYAPAIPIVRILGLALVLRSINSYLTSVLYAYGHFKRVMTVALWNVVAVALILSLFVPMWGAIGVPLALLATEAINTVIQALLVGYVFHKSGASAGKLETSSV